MLQYDGYNCGVIILYYFEKISQIASLVNRLYSKENHYGFWVKYRQALAKLLLTSSDDMREICLNCGRNAFLGVGRNNILPNLYVTCLRCKRHIHIDCSKHQTELFDSKKKLCMLCQNFISY